MKKLAAFVLLVGCSSPAKHDRIPYDGCIHAHNDYEHVRPLLDALDAGACSVEADVWLVNSSNLLIAHDLPDVDPSRTLQSLYLDPLATRAATLDDFTLLIDVKSDAAATWPVLESALAQYGYLTMWTGSAATPGAVTALVSGNRDRAAMEAAPVRHAAYDGRLTDLGTGVPTSFMPVISHSWLLVFPWNGAGPMPDDERALLESYVAQTHAEGRKLRFFGPADDVDIWREQAKAGVDLLNADSLTGAATFLEQETAPTPP